MSNTERKKAIDDIVDFLERAKAMVDEIKTDDESELKALENEAKEAQEGDADEPTSTDEMATLEGAIETLDEAISAIDDAIGLVIRVE